MSDADATAVSTATRSSHPMDRLRGRNLPPVVTPLQAGRRRCGCNHAPPPTTQRPAALSSPGEEELGCCGAGPSPGQGVQGGAEKAGPRSFQPDGNTGPASMGQKNQASGKEVSIPGWTLLIQELPRDQSSSPSKREIKQTSKKSSPAQTTWTLTSPLGHNQHVSG